MSEDATPKKKSKLLLILLPVMLLAGGGGLYLGFTQYARLAAAAAVLADDAGTAEEEPVEFGEFLEVQGLIVNPAGTDGQRYLMINIGLESNKGSVLEELEEKEIVVRDRVLRLLSQRTVEDLADIGLREPLKDELRGAINRVLENGEVTRLYFTQYVLQ